MAQCTFCLKNLATGCMNNELEAIFVKTASVNLYVCDHRSENCAVTSSAAPRLKRAITIVSRNWAEVVLIPLHSFIFVKELESIDEGPLDLVLDLHLKDLRVNAINFLSKQAFYFAVTNCHHDVSIAAVVRALAFRRCSAHRLVNLLIV